MPEWERVRLGEVVRHRKEFITIDDLTEYKRCRVQVRARGVALRDTVPGSAIKTKKQQVCRAGEFLVAEIDAKMGGFGLVPDELEGAVVSSHYFLFEVDETRLDREFLNLYSKTPEFMEQVSAQGSTNYAAIRPGDVLGYTLPLPPLPEQRRIVARVKGLLGKVEEARGLAAEVKIEQRELLQAMAYRSDLSDEEKLGQGWQRVTLAEVMHAAAQREVVRADGAYPNFGIYSFGRGLFMKPNISGMDTSAQALYKVQSGQFIYSRLFAFEGAYGVVDPEFDGYYVSNEYPAFEINPSLATPEFLKAYFSRRSLWPTLAAGSKGLGDRRQRIQPDQILGHEILLPPLLLQERLTVVSRAVERASAEAAVSREHLDALPASILARAFAGAL